jgi:hypothetical protein
VEEEVSNFWEEQAVAVEEPATGKPAGNFWESQAEPFGEPEIRMSLPERAGKEYPGRPQAQSRR